MKSAVSQNLCPDALRSLVSAVQYTGRADRVHHHILRSFIMGSSDADLALIKQIQPVVSGIGGVLSGAAAILGLIGALNAFS